MLWNATIEYVLVAETASVLFPSFGTWEVSMNLSNIDRSGKMTAQLPTELMEAIKIEPLTYNAHHKCVSINSHNGNEALRNFFNILSTNVDSSKSPSKSMWNRVRFKWL